MIYERYNIQTKPAPNIAPHPVRFLVNIKRLKLAELLIKETIKYRGNLRVVLDRPCVYGVFSGPIGGFAPDERRCVGCLRCTIQHPHIVEIRPNPARLELGDSYFSPDVVDTVLYEAASGHIPVRGAGYRGKFGGRGWDGMWTDMSEIVRPTRDGIHGREFISTSVDLGEKPAFLTFDHRGNPAGQVPSTDHIPIPFVFDLVPVSTESDSLYELLVKAAERIETFAFVPIRHAVRFSMDSRHLIPVVGSGDLGSVVELNKPPRFIGLDGWDPQSYLKLKELFPESMAILRIPHEPDLSEYLMAGIRIFHLVADYHGNTQMGFVGEAIRTIHENLVTLGLREEVTLIGSGGIAAAEHLPKAIISGLDIVALETPLLIAIQANFVEECRDRDSAEVEFPEFDQEWAVQRLANLAASWRDQLLEILGAMGLREVRRLRGEVGRAMYQAELEREAFAGIEGFEVGK